MKTGTDIQPLNDFYAHDLERFNFDKKELHALLRQRSIKYGEYLLHGEMAPMILEKKELKRFQSDAELVLKASELFSQEALKNEKWLADCLPDRFMRELVKVDPGYDQFIPCARFDSFPCAKGPVMIELNTDGCSGMSNLDTFHSLYLDLIASSPFFPKGRFTTEKILPHLLDTLLKCYASFRKRFPKKGQAWPAKPTIAIVDWQTEETSWEFYACQEFFGSRGLRAIVADPRELKCDGDSVSVAGQTIHLVYRRLLGEDWGKNRKALSVLTNAYKEHKVCVVGSPRSQIAFSKKLFAYLRNEDMLKKYTPAIRAAVERTVPWTVPLREGKAGILQGCHTAENVWKKGVKAALGDDFIIQEFIPLVTAHFPVHGKVREEEKRYLHSGIYVFGGKFSGFFGRTCKDPLLTLRHGERMLAILWKNSAKRSAD